MRSMLDEGPAGALRVAILALVAVSVFGTAAALAYDRHWDEPWQLVPWGTLAGITLAAAAFLIRVTRLTIWLAKAMAIITIVVAGLGGWQHFNENYKTAPLGRSLQWPLG